MRDACAQFRTRRKPVATHWDSNDVVSTTQGKSGAHSQSVKLNVTPASDVIALLFRYR